MSIRRSDFAWKILKQLCKLLDNPSGNYFPIFDLIQRQGC